MKKIFRMAVVCALAGATLLYTGCTKDYSDDINDLKDRVSTLESTISAIQAQVGAGYYITNVQDVDGGFKVSLSNGKDYTITSGKDGKDGEPGKNGTNGTNGTNGKDGSDGDDGAPGKDGSVVTIDKTTGNWFIDGKDTGVKAEATVDEISIENGEICINGKSTGVKAGTVAVWDQTAGTVTFKGINADGSDLVIGVCELESIVAIPQFYLEGIEGFAYNYLFGKYNSTVSYTGGAVTDDESATATPVASGKHAWEVDGGDYSLGETATAEYHVNPNSFDITAADFALAGFTKGYITRATVTDWSVALDTIYRDATSKYAQVKYHITNPHNVTDSTESGKVGVMNLTGTVKNGGKAVASDYVAIIPFRQQLHHLAFQDQLAYVTKYDANYASAAATYPCDPSTTAATGKCKLPSPLSLEKELYTETVQAIKEIPSVEVNYLKTLDLNTILAVHYHPSDNKVHGVKDAEQTMNLAEFLAKYPDLKASYEVVPYTLGSTNTREDKYAQIDGSVFYPCWVESDETTQHRNIDKYDGYDGHSSINRKPIILATITDASGKVVLYGYFKIKIVETVVTPTPTTKGYLIKDLGSFPYVCAYTNATKWADCSHTVLEQLHITYADFIKYYVHSSSPDGKTYIKDGETFKDVTPDATHVYYGEFKYTQASTGDGVNDVYSIDVTSNEQLKNVNEKFDGTVTLYGKFTHKTNGNVIYLGLKYTVADPAKAKFIEHNSTYWKIAKDQTTDNLLIINPIVPNTEYATGSYPYGDVTNYSFWIDKSWTPNRVQMSLDEASKAVYGSIWDSSDKYYHYEFNAKQPKIAGKNLIVKKGTDEDYIYLGTEAADNLLATINTQNVRKNSLVPDATDNNAGEDLEGASTKVVDRKFGRITYANNKNAQDVLNSFAHPTFSSTNKLEEDNLSSMLYFNVDLVATYQTTTGTVCEIPLGTETFHVAFFRPVDLKQGNPNAVKDALPLGDKICVGDLFYAEDWQNYKIIVKNATTGKYEAGYFEGVVNWFDFYQFSKLNVGIKTIKTNQNGLTTPKYLFNQTDGTEGVNNAALAQLVLKKYTAADTFTYEVITDGVIDFTTAVVTEDGATTVTGADVLNYYFINYSNYEGVAANFKLYVPVEVEYSWGKVTKEIEVPVTGTGL